MRMPNDVTTLAHRKVQRNLKTLLTGEPVAFSVPLHPPTGQAIHANPDAATAFIRAWETHDGVTYETRNLSRWGLGTQQLPIRYEAASNAELISLAGYTSEFERLTRSLDVLEDVGSRRVVVSRRAVVDALPLWRDLPPTDIAHARRVTQWFCDHPDTGVLPRAVAVEGVHGKWIEQHRRLLEHLLSIARGGNGDLGLGSVHPTIRLRFAPGSGPAGLDDISVPNDTIGKALSGAREQIEQVLFLENKETFLSLTPQPGTCLIFGSGYRAHHSASLNAFDGKRILYWGDLDLDGYQILDAVRSQRPNAESVLMGPDTVISNLDIATPDRDFTPTTLTRLTPEENKALDILITHGHLRIEQERINIEDALKVLRQFGVV